LKAAVPNPAPGDTYSVDGIVVVYTNRGWLQMGSLNTDINNGSVYKPTFVTNDISSTTDTSVTTSNLKFGTALKTQFTPNITAKSTYKFSVSLAITPAKKKDFNLLKTNFSIVGPDGKSVITNGFITRTSGVTQKGVQFQLLKYEGYITPAISNPTLTIQVVEANKRKINIGSAYLDFSKVEFKGLVNSLPINAAVTPAKANKSTKSSSTTAIVIKAKPSTTTTTANNPSAVKAGSKPAATPSPKSSLASSATKK